MSISNQESKEKGERLTSVPDDIPEESIEEEETQVHAEHDGESECWLIPAESTSEQSIATVLYFHTDHDSNGILERKGEEEVRFSEFTSEDEDPETDRGETLFDRESRVGSREGLRCQVFARLSSHSVSKKSTRGNDREENEEGDGEGKLNDTDDESCIRGLIESDDVDGGSESDCETNEESDHSTKEMRSVVPSSRYVRVFGSGSEDLNE